MNKFLLKILILCTVITGSFLAVQTNAQNTVPKLDITTTEKDTIGTVSIKTTGFQTIEKEKDGFYSLNIYKKNSLNNFIPIKRETEKIASIEYTTTEITGLPKGDYRAIGVFVNMDTPNNQPITTQKDFSVKNSTKGPLCMVLNATFNPSGTQPAGWFKDSQRPKVSVDIQTSDCAKNFLIFSITEADYFGDDQTSEVEEKKILVTDTEKMTLQFEAGETDCDGENSPDCQYYIEIDMENSNGNVISSFSSQGRTNGELLYDCDGPCVSDWKPLNMPESGQAVTASADMTPNADTDTTYTPLAPISETLGGCTLPDGTIKENCIDTAEAGAFGKYFNALIRIFIGFCAVLAMIFIVVGGMQYMTSELVSGKEEAKKRIWGAVGGLILALASYAILNTINPQLLDISLSGVAKAEILQEENETINTAVSGNNSGSTEPTKLCPEGFENITTNTNVKMFLCKKISQKVKNLIEKAKTENIVLAGGAYRTAKEQEATRARNCGGVNNVFNKNAKCNPPTAYPGTSRHEQGLAIDFTCSGVLIQTKDNECFLWLQRNGVTYGLKNYEKEPWHWSFDGR